MNIYIEAKSKKEYNEMVSNYTREGYNIENDFGDTVILKKKG